jgi:hypothetical protein
MRYDINFKFGDVYLNVYVYVCVYICIDTYICVFILKFVPLNKLKDYICGSTCKCQQWEK